MCLLAALRGTKTVDWDIGSSQDHFIPQAKEKLESKSKATPKCPHPPTPHHQVACPLKGVWTFNRILWHMLQHCVSEYRVSRLSCTQFGGYFHHPCVYGAGAQTRGGTHVRQALYQLSDTSAFVFFFFKSVASLFITNGTNYHLWSAYCVLSTDDSDYLSHQPDEQILIGLPGPGTLWCEDFFF